jgi:16S rRNA (guanine966-N2)-methyltransferase
MKRGQVRIIGGQWRGRLLSVPDSPDLRPTPDRVRETVFNWLTPFIHQARCLDVFAGSGVLGLEALSRGASYAELVDQSQSIVDHLKETIILLKTSQAQVYQASVPAGLHRTEKPFNIVFLDPPYQSDLLLRTCFYLEEHRFLAQHAHIYLEAKHAIKDNDLPHGWRIIKVKQAGQVFYHLAYRERK